MSLEVGRFREADLVWICLLMLWDRICIHFNEITCTSYNTIFFSKYLVTFFPRKNTLILARKIFLWTKFSRQYLFTFSKWRCYRKQIFKFFNNLENIMIQIWWVSYKAEGVYSNCVTSIYRKVYSPPYCCGWYF